MVESVPPLVLRQFGGLLQLHKKTAGHLSEHIRAHPSHGQYYSYKLKRLGGGKASFFIEGELLWEGGRLGIWSHWC
ncbi:hypothetical protein CsSME_00050159 [Camellia sinensis var. sinensis]